MSPFKAQGSNNKVISQHLIAEIESLGIEDIEYSDYSEEMGKDYRLLWFTDPVTGSMLTANATDEPEKVREHILKSRRRFNDANGA